MNAPDYSPRRRRGRWRNRRAAQTAGPNFCGPKSACLLRPTASLGACKCEPRLPSLPFGDAAKLGQPSKLIRRANRQSGRSDRLTPPLRPSDARPKPCFAHADHAKPPEASRRSGFEPRHYRPCHSGESLVFVAAYITHIGCLFSELERDCTRALNGLDFVNSLAIQTATREANWHPLATRRLLSFRSSLCCAIQV